MKKLIIAAAMICAVVSAQAATVNWNISGVKADGGGSPTAGWAVMAFYTEVGAGSSAIESAINSKTAGSLTFDASKSLVVSMSKGKVAAHDASVAALDTTKNYDFYFVVFNDADATKATKYAMVSALNQEYSSLDANYTVTGAFSASTAWTSITPPAPVIPEPTTGLLVLLGVAGLALRRKQA